MQVVILVSWASDQEAETLQVFQSQVRRIGEWIGTPTEFTIGIPEQQLPRESAQSQALHQPVVPRPIQKMEQHILTLTRQQRSQHELRH